MRSQKTCRSDRKLIIFTKVSSPGFHSAVLCRLREEGKNFLSLFKFRLAGENICVNKFLRCSNFGKDLLWELLFSTVPFPPTGGHFFSLASVFCATCHKEENHRYEEIFLSSCSVSWEPGFVTSENIPPGLHQPEDACPGMPLEDSQIDCESKKQYSLGSTLLLKPSRNLWAHHSPQH